MTVTIDFAAINLAKGSHDVPPGDVDESCELCLFEWRNWLTSRLVTDSCPSNVSPLLHAFGMSLNDRFPGEKRQQLKQFLPQPDGTDLLAGTADDGLDDERGYLARDWLIRTYTPAWLDLVGLTAEAAELRALRRIVDKATAETAGPIVNSAREKAAAAWDVAWDVAAGAAAWDAAWAAAWDVAWVAAAGAAAWDVAWVAAGAAARVAAGAAARVAAGAAARVAAGAAARVAAGAAVAGDVARAAARAAARVAAGAAAGVAAGDVARAAARERLAPTVDQLQDSAINLYAALINPRSAAA